MVLSDGLGLTSYLQIQVMQGDTPFGLRHYWKSHFVDALPDDLIDRIVDHYLAHPQDGWDVVLFEQMHGAAGTKHRCARPAGAHPRQQRRYRAAHQFWCRPGPVRTTARRGGGDALRPHRRREIVRPCDRRRHRRNRRQTHRQLNAMRTHRCHR